MSASVLITGGSDGIGKALAKRYLAAGAKVLVTGRSRDKLDRAAAELPGLETVQNDIASADERVALVEKTRAVLPELDVVINNAGIQRRIAIAEDQADWGERQAEIDTLLAGPIHLCHLFIPLLLETKRPSLLVNVTSGGAFVPQVFAPVYSACKAALHSYTVTLRHALAETACRVVEIIPPRVQTSLGGASTIGAPIDDFADTVFADLALDVDEIGYGPTAAIGRKSRAELDEMFVQTSSRFPVKRY